MKLVPNREAQEKFCDSVIKIFSTGVIREQFTANFLCEADTAENKLKKSSNLIGVQLHFLVHNYFC